VSSLEPEVAEVDEEVEGRRALSAKRAQILASTTDEWNFTVPDDSELLAELHRHGVRPGRRLRGSVVSDEVDATAGRTTSTRRRLGFAGSIHAEPDLSEKRPGTWRGFGRE